MHASLAMRGVAVAGLVTLAVLFGAVPKASAEDVTIEVVEPRGGRAGESGVSRAGGQESRKEPSGHQGQDHLVREESARARR